MEIVWARFSGHLAIMLAVFLPGYGKRLFRMRRPTVQIGRSLLMLLSKIVFVTAIARVPLATLRRGDPGAPGARLKRAEILSRETLLGLAADLAEVAAPLIEHSGSSKKMTGCRSSRLARRPIAWHCHAAFASPSRSRGCSSRPAAYGEKCTLRAQPMVARGGCGAMRFDRKLRAVYPDMGRGGSSGRR
jgi:hypothetical protein